MSTVIYRWSNTSQNGTQEFFSNDYSQATGNPGPLTDGHKIPYYGYVFITPLNDDGTQLTVEVAFGALSEFNGNSLTWEPYATLNYGETLEKEFGASGPKFIRVSGNNDGRAYITT